MFAVYSLIRYSKSLKNVCMLYVCMCDACVCDVNLCMYPFEHVMLVNSIFARIALFELFLGTTSVITHTRRGLIDNFTVNNKSHYIMN